MKWLVIIILSVATVFSLSRPIPVWAATGTSGSQGAVLAVEGNSGIIGWAQGATGNMISVDVYVTQRGDPATNSVCSQGELAANQTVLDTENRVGNYNGKVFVYKSNCLDNLSDGDYDVYLALGPNLWVPGTFQFTVKTIETANNSRIWLHYLGKMIDRVPGNYDSYPTVIKDGDVYKMWYVSGNGGDTIYYATSGDGISWNLVNGPLSGGAVLAPTTTNCVCNNNGLVGTCSSGTFSADDMHTADPSVVKVNGVYYMYYTGASKQWSCFGSNNQVYLATSTDGINWTKYKDGSGNLIPIMSPLHPCMNQTQCSTNYGAGQSSVIYKDGKYTQYYTDMTDQTMAFSMGTSLDGKNFGSIKNGVMGDVTWDIKYSSYLGNYFGMVSIPSSPRTPGTLRITTSSDGVNWKPTVNVGMGSMKSDVNHYVPNNGGLLSDPTGIITGNHTVFYTGAGWGMQDGGDAATNSWDIVGVDVWFSKATPTSFNVNLDGNKVITVDVLYPEIDRNRAEFLTRLADRGTVTTDPIHQSVSGLFTPLDRIVITKSLLIWFSLSGPLGGITNGGGGFIRGVWTLTKDSGGFYNFSMIRNGNNWAPNEFLPGANGNGALGSGISFLGVLGEVNVDDPGNVGAIAAENSGVRNFVLDKVPIADGGWGNNRGYFYQTTGYLTHSQTDMSKLLPAGYDSIYDTNPIPGLEVKVEYLDGYRIMVDEPILEHSILLTPQGGATGKFVTFVLSHNNAGSTGFEHKYYRTDVGTATYNGCTRIPEYSPNQIVYIGETDALRWWGNATLRLPGTRWVITETIDGKSGRTLQIEPLLNPPYLIPDKLQIIRNNYSSGNGTWINAYDVNYTDGNQCGGNIVWQENQQIFIGTRLTFNTAPTLLLLGDANGDGHVDGADYVIWLNHYGQSVTGSSNGDFNNDSKVNGLDYVIWLNNYTSVIQPTLTMTPVPIPLPTQVGSCTCQNGVVVANECISPNLPFCTIKCICGLVSPAP